MRKFQNSFVLAAVSAIVTLTACGNTIQGTKIQKENTLVGVISDAQTGQGIPGIAVTDGTQIVQTDRHGVYQMRATERARTVCYTTPATYEMAVHEDGSPAFFAYIDTTKALDRHDFTLRKLPAPEEDFTLVVMADPQCMFNSDVERFRTETVPDVGKVAANAIAGTGKRVYGIGLGDIVYDNLTIWEPMSKLFRAIPLEGGGTLPVYNIPGNHDHCNKVDNEYDAVANYIHYFGPTDYSFDRGKLHFICMDNITFKYDDGIEEVLQSSLFAQGGKLPQGVKDYIDSLLWQNIVKPYTIARNMSFLLYYYSYNAEHGSDKYKQSVTIDSNSLLQMEKDGLIKYSEKDRALLKRFQDMSDEFKQAKEEDYEALNEKHKELIEQFNAFFQRDDVQAAIEESVDAIETEVAISDSIYPDALLRDFSRAQKLYERLDHNRKPLNRTQMAVLNQIQLPAVRSTLLAENDKFVNMQKAEVANAECLRPSSDVEGLTDGEAILRKILEPFKGRIVYLDIWGTWCGPCKDKLKESHFVKEQLKDFDIVYLYLANTSPEESWKNVIKEYNLTGPNCVHYNLPKSQQRAVEQFLKVESFPTYKLIDKQGNIHDLHWLHTNDMKTFKETIANLN